MFDETCFVCGAGFTREEWLNRHTAEDHLHDVHAECCTICAKEEH